MRESQTEKEEMRHQQRMKVMKDVTRKIRARRRMEANNSWWVREQLAADCEQAWLHSGWEDAMQKWYNLLYAMKSKDEAQMMAEELEKQISRMIKSADRSAGLLHKFTRPTAWRGRVQILTKEDAKRLTRYDE